MRFNKNIITIKLQFFICIITSDMCIPVSCINKFNIRNLWQETASENNHSLNTNSIDVTHGSYSNEFMTNERIIKGLKTNMKLKNMHKTPKTSDFQRNYLIFVRTQCSRDLFDMQIELNQPFNGLLYAKDFPSNCRAVGNNSTYLALSLPTSSCGIRFEALTNGYFEFSVLVILQVEQKLHQSSDLLRTVRCQLPIDAFDIALNTTPYDEKLFNYRTARMHHANMFCNDVSAQSSSISWQNLNFGDGICVRIWLELGSTNGSGFVIVGQETTLTVHAIVPSSIGVQVVDCDALDGLDESNHQLLNKYGCPMDENIMPALKHFVVPIEAGWSKRSLHETVDNIFKVNFPAFKFPERERLHVSCNVQLCIGDCSYNTCDSWEHESLRNDVHLARIKIYNSIAVAAPQIENEYFGFDSRRNSSNTQHNAGSLTSETTFCISLSKMAIFSCLLSFILFIVVFAVFFAILRPRKLWKHRPINEDKMGILSGTASNSRQTVEPCTSTVSTSGESSQLQRCKREFSMAYYSRNLHYGRVF